jgi:hypothetical protein
MHEGNEHEKTRTCNHNKYTKSTIRWREQKKNNPVSAQRKQRTEKEAENGVSQERTLEEKHADEPSWQPRQTTKMIRVSICSRFFLQKSYFIAFFFFFVATRTL